MGKRGARTTFGTPGPGLRYTRSEGPRGRHWTARDSSEHRTSTLVWSLVTVMLIPCLFLGIVWLGQQFGL